MNIIDMGSIHQFTVWLDSNVKIPIIFSCWKYTREIYCWVWLLRQIENLWPVFELNPGNGFSYRKVPTLEITAIQVSITNLTGITRVNYIVSIASQWSGFIKAFLGKSGLSKYNQNWCRKLCYWNGFDVRHGHMDHIVLSKIAWGFNFHEMHQNQNTSFAII